MTIATAKMICDSISSENIRLRTMQLRYPRIIHSEFMTHRAFSRNARSSRAVPVAQMIKEVKEDPFIPVHWGLNQKGMQAGQECNADVYFHEYAYEKCLHQDLYCTRSDAWLYARDQALKIAQAFTEAGYHKQVVNRLIEPFTFIDVLVSATDFNNFYALRRHEAAEPHMRMLADAMWECEQASTPKYLHTGEWHLPFIAEEEQWADSATLTKMSVDRCKRISYKPYTNAKERDAEIKGHDDLINARPVHATPTEHQATPDELKSNGWKNPTEHGNFRGWRQYRQMIPNEAVPG
jgi:hypothetical protein